MGIASRNILIKRAIDIQYSPQSDVHSVRRWPLPVAIDRGGNQINRRCGVNILYQMQASLSEACNNTDCRQIRL